MKLFVLAALVADENFGTAELDQFLAKVRKIADYLLRNETPGIGCLRYTYSLLPRSKPARHSTDGERLPLVTLGSR